jgi:hypothetical protein
MTVLVEKNDENYISYLRNQLCYNEEEVRELYLRISDLEEQIEELSKYSLPVNSLADAILAERLLELIQAKGLDVIQAIIKD